MVRTLNNRMKFTITAGLLLLAAMTLPAPAHADPSDKFWQTDTLARTECGYSFDPATDDIDQFDIEMYGVESVKELAEEFFEDGLFGNIPQALEFYFDYEAIARDLALDYSMTEIAGDRIAYRLG